MIDSIMDISKRRGIVYPSFEIYGGVSGFVDYGPMGSRIKQNIEDLLRRHYVVCQGCFEVQCPTLSPEDVWIASGHVNSFADVMTECNKCGECFRADKLLSGAGVEAEGMPPEQMHSLLVENKIVCPDCGCGLSEPYEYNLMFQTSIGAGKGGKTGYMRPETAQSTYLAFKRLWEFARRRLPFGVIQIGHSFRNEISPRQGMIRLREFNQAEIQFFMDPEDKSAPGFDEVLGRKVTIKDKNDRMLETTLGEAHEKGVIEIQFIAYQLGKALDAFEDMGIDPGKLRLRQHRDDERSFYSSDTWDVEYVSDVYGEIEIVGIADRTDYDLKQHMEHSKERMTVSYDGRKFVPHVVEVAYGIDRPIYCVLESCLRSEEDRTDYFAFPKQVAPYLAGVFPLVRKDGIPEKADEVFKLLTDMGLYVFSDRSGSIGKRYARADEIGVPYCVTIDYDTLEDDKVTVRNRDSTEQERVNVEELGKFLLRL